MITPIVSIVVPNYNNTQYLKELVSCFLRQTYDKWELIIIDDGSTDNSFEFAKKLSYDDQRIYVYSRNRDPKGGQTCRNLGYEYSRGKYIIFFDSDDMISDNCLEQRVRYMESHPDLDFSIFPTHSFKPRTDYQTLRKLDIKWGKRINGDIIDKFLRIEYPFLVVSCIYKKESIIDIKWREDIPIRQDLMFNLTVLFSGLNYDFCDSSDYDYFYRVEHTTNNLSKNMTTPLKYHGMLKVFDFCFENIRNFNKKRRNKYQSALKRYIVNYGGQLASSGNEDLCNNYLTYCSKHYSSFFTKKLSVAFGITSRLLKYNKFNKLNLSFIVFMLFFWHRFYFDLMKKAVLKLIYS